MLHNKSVPQCSQSKQLVSGLHGLHAYSRARLPGGGRRVERELQASFTKCLQINVFSYSYLTSRAVGWPRVWLDHWAEIRLTHHIPKAELKLSTGWHCIQHHNYSRHQVEKMTGQQRRWFGGWISSIFILSTTVPTMNWLSSILCDQSLVQLNSFLQVHWGEHWFWVNYCPAC